MRICRTYQVKFQGKLANLGTPSVIEYWVADDDNNRSKVHIPNHPKIIEAFEWMDENDCLRHLQNVGPAYTTNILEVEEVERINAMITENAYALPLSSKTYCVQTGTYRPMVQGLRTVPDRAFEVVWTFWSKEHAIMFKLACGGDLED